MVEKAPTSTTTTSTTTSPATSPATTVPASEGPTHRSCLAHARSSSAEVVEGKVDLSSLTKRVSFSAISSEFSTSSSQLTKGDYLPLQNQVDLSSAKTTGHPDIHFDHFQIQDGKFGPSRASRDSDPSTNVSGKHSDTFMDTTNMDDNWHNALISNQPATAYKENKAMYKLMKKKARRNIGLKTNDLHDNPSDSFHTEKSLFERMLIVSLPLTTYTNHDHFNSFSSSQTTSRCAPAPPQVRLSEYDSSPDLVKTKTPSEDTCTSHHSKPHIVHRGSPPSSISSTDSCTTSSFPGHSSAVQSSPKHSNDIHDMMCQLKIVTPASTTPPTYADRNTDSSRGGPARPPNIMTTSTRLHDIDHEPNEINILSTTQSATTSTNSSPSVSTQPKPKFLYTFDPTKKKGLSSQESTEIQTIYIPGIQLFCFPDYQIISALSASSNPSHRDFITNHLCQPFYSFVLTGKDGDYLYGYCRRIFFVDQIICICIVSKFSWLSTYQQLLQIFHDELIRTLLEHVSMDIVHCRSLDKQPTLDENDLFSANSAKRKAFVNSHTNEHEHCCWTPPVKVLQETLNQLPYLISASSPAWHSVFQNYTSMASIIIKQGIPKRGETITISYEPSNLDPNLPETVTFEDFIDSESKSEQSDTRTTTKHDNRPLVSHAFKITKSSVDVPVLQDLRSFEEISLSVDLQPANDAIKSADSQKKKYLTSLEEDSPDHSTKSVTVLFHDLLSMVNIGGNDVQDKIPLNSLPRQDQKPTTPINKIYYEDSDTGSCLIQKNFARPLHFVPSYDCNFEIVFSCLQAPSFVKVLSAILQERRIIFISTSVSSLSLSIHAFVSLLYPFAWHHIYIPILPPHLLDYMCAPMPFIVGIHSSQVKSLSSMPLEDVVLVNLDRGSIACSDGSDVTKFIPRGAKAELQLQLFKLGKLKADTSLSKKVGDVLIHFFACMMKDFIVFRTKSCLEKYCSPEQMDIFISELKDPEKCEFWKQFRQTQMFEQWNSSSDCNPSTSVDDDPFVEAVDSEFDEGSTTLKAWRNRAVTVYHEYKCKQKMASQDPKSASDCLPDILPDQGTSADILLNDSANEWKSNGTLFKDNSNRPWRRFGIEDESIHLPLSGRAKIFGSNKTEAGSGKEKSVPNPVDGDRKGATASRSNSADERRKRNSFLKSVTSPRTKVDSTSPSEEDRKRNLLLKSTTSSQPKLEYFPEEEGEEKSSNANNTLTMAKKKAQEYFTQVKGKYMSPSPSKRTPPVDK